MAELEKEFNERAYMHKIDVVFNVFHAHYLEEEEKHKGEIDLPPFIKEQMFQELTYPLIESMYRHDREKFDILYNMGYEVFSNQCKNERFGI